MVFVVLKSPTVTLLTDVDRPQVERLLALEPVANAFVTSRVQAAGCDSWRLGAELWGIHEGRRLKALCYAGANLVPAGADAQQAAVFADRARRQGRRCSSIVGPVEAVEAMWRRLAPSWGPAREVRSCQPLMAMQTRPLVPPDPAVRRIARSELDVVMPAAVAMFTEEVGVSPLLGDGGVMYRARLDELIRAGHAFGRIEDGQVLFKAELGAVSDRVCQVQGVWTDPARRGSGIGTAGMAAVVELARRTVAPVVSLYVNDYNAAALAVYERVGFARVGTYMSVLF